MPTLTKAQLQEKYDDALIELEVARDAALVEAYSNAARTLLAAEDIGWVKLGVTRGDVAGMTLEEAKTLSAKLHGYAETNPLLVRGREIRNSYLLSAEYEIGTKDAKGKISPQQYGYINRQKNQDNVFSLEALERIEGERYAAGQAYVTYNKTLRNFQQISFQEISGHIYNPDDATEIWYVQRTWSAVVVNAKGSTSQVERKAWYPASRHELQKGETHPKMIDNVAVDTNTLMIVERVNVQPGGNLGIPDSFAAAPWALAYSAYLSDGSKVLAALAEWAWLVKPKKRNPAERAVASVRSERGAGGTLVTDMDVQAMPSKNAVDLNTGRPLAAQVAASLGVSIVLLLADPGQSGAYGTAQTLSDPNRRTMEARRQRTTAFLEHCLSLLGINNPAVTWPKMSPGSDIDEVTLVNMIFGTGMFWEDEIRPRLAELGHITVLHDEPPAGFMYPNNEQSLARKDIDSDGSGSDGSDSSDGASMTDGANSMVNGQGKNNLSLGNISHRSKSEK